MQGGAQKPKEPLELLDQEEFDAPEEQSKITGKLRKLEGATIRHAHQFLIRRWKNLQEVRRHALGWLFLVVAMSAAVVWQSSQTMNAYSVELPSEGTTYSEGVLGSVDNLNPIFASTQAERSASRLIFANLLTYDEKGDLVGELAERWNVEPDGKSYKVQLRNNARWHDGQPITADDILFTFAAIKDADTRSPLYSSWRNIAVEKVDQLTVRFILPTSYSPFPNSLTIGILPKHILGDLRAAQLRNNSFNTAPIVGSGPFAFQDMRALDSERTRYILRLSANQEYFGGTPKPSRFNLQAFADRDQLINAFRAQEVAAVADLASPQLATLSGRQDIVKTESPLFNAVYAFFKMDSAYLQDDKVRLALQYATNRAQLIEKLDNRFEPVIGPLLPGQLGYKSDLRQADDKIRDAEKLLDEAGWKLNRDGKRMKGDQQLKIQIATVSEGDYPLVAQELIDQWSRLGITLESNVIRSEEIQQNVIAPRAYDVLIYELAIGRDPDVFAYWHSSQANERGFNLSDYKSGRIDDILDSARSTLDSNLRSAKYGSFIQQWLADVPAVGLYRPSMSYVQTRNVTSFTPRPLAEQVNRYFNVRYWSAAKEQLSPTL